METFWFALTSFVVLAIALCYVNSKDRFNRAYPNGWRRRAIARSKLYFFIWVLATALYAVL